MRNIKLIIEYDGTNYNGWQKQNPKSEIRNPKLRTIQEEIEKAIEKITAKKPKLFGSGRTDSGVHAKAQVANFHTNTSLNLNKLKRGLNAVLPKDISIIKTEEANKDFHSRFNVKSKIYRYTILNRNSQSPFLKRYSLHLTYKLNLLLMEKEAKVLLGKHNFKSFAATGKIEKSTTRIIKKITIKTHLHLRGAGMGLGIITIDIEANGFLYNMVRNIVGTLIEIGRGKLFPGSMKQILNAKDRTKAGPTAKACGLCLIRVKY